MRSPPWRSFQWQMCDHLTLRPWVRWWKAIEMRKNLKQDLNKEEELSRLIGGRDIPGRRGRWGGKARWRGVNMTCFWGTHSVSRCRGAKSREMESDEVTGWRWGCTSQCWAHRTGHLIHEFFPQFYPSLKYHLLLRVHCGNYIYEWVLFVNKIINCLMSRMISLITYNPNGTWKTTLHKYLAHLNRIQLWPVCMITSLSPPGPSVSPGTHRQQHTKLEGSHSHMYSCAHSWVRQCQANTAGLLRACLLNLCTVGYNR